MSNLRDAQMVPHLLRRYGPSMVVENIEVPKSYCFGLHMQYQIARSLGEAVLSTNNEHENALSLSAR